MKATVAECEKALKENRRTLQRDLKLLVSQGLVREISFGPTDPSPDSMRRLGGLFYAF